MMDFTAKDVSVLRERTGCGMMDCKKALSEAEGDMEKAIEVLRERGLAKAAKKAGRIAAEGLVLSVVDEKKKIGVILEVNAETDFVAKNEQFKAFIGMCASILLEQRPNSVEELMDCKDSSGMTVAQILQDKILTIGENLVVRRFEILEGNLISYVHGEGKIAVLVRFDTDLYENENFKPFAKDVAMQIAALNPSYINKSDVPSGDIEKEKEILIAQIKLDPQMESKPAQVIEKMVLGRLNKKFYQDACLVEQPFVKDAALTVGEYTNASAKQMGGKISISKFLRYEKGEGIEKKANDFAAEVASMIK